MASWREVIHFFGIVGPVPRLMKTTFCGVTACAVAIVVWDPARATVALTPILVLQLFATSSGFMLSARRGHYDLLLTRGHSRLQIAAVHWMMCTLPGIAAWAAVAGVELVASVGTSRLLLQAGTLSALLIVSTLPWAVTVALPRFAGAVGWLVALTLFALIRAPAGTTQGMAPLEAATPALEAVVALVLYPPFMVGQALNDGVGLMLVAPVAVAVASVGCALMWIRQQDIPLEASQ